MYCGVEEAFDNPLQQQLKEFEKEQQINNYKQSLVDNVKMEQDVNRLESPQDNSAADANYSYFTAQGNIGSFEGTKIKDLKSKDTTSLGSLIDTDLSDYSNESLFSESIKSLPSSSSVSMDTVSLLDFKKNKKKYINELESIDNSMKDRSHEYYIRHFIKDFKDTESIAFSKKEYEDLHDHLKTCRYCKEEIKLRLNGTIVDNVPEKQNIIKKPVELGPSHGSSIMDRVDIKDVVVVIVVGIIIIFLLDLFIKINKKLRN